MGNPAAVQMLDGIFQAKAVMPFFMPESAAFTQRESSLAGGQCLRSEQANLMLRKHHRVWDSLTSFSLVSWKIKRWKS